MNPDALSKQGSVELGNAANAGPGEHSCSVWISPSHPSAERRWSGGQGRGAPVQATPRPFQAGAWELYKNLHPQQEQLSFSRQKPGAGPGLRRERTAGTTVEPLAHLFLLSTGFREKNL